MNDDLITKYTFSSSIVLDLGYGKVSRGERNFAPRSEKVRHILPSCILRWKRIIGRKKMSLQIMKRDKRCFVVQVGEEEE